MEGSSGPTVRRRQLGGVLFAIPRQRDRQSDFKPEAALAIGTDSHFGSDGGVGWKFSARMVHDVLHRIEKACCITCGEELFGVRAIAASAAEFLRQGQLEIKVALGTVARPSRPPVTCA